MVYITSLVLIYLIPEVSTFCLPLSSYHPPLGTNLSLLSLLVFEVHLSYNTVLIPLTQHDDSVFLCSFTHKPNSWLCPSEERLPCQKTVTWWLAVERSVFPGVTSCHATPWVVVAVVGEEAENFLFCPGFLRCNWHDIILVSGLQHNDLIFVYNVKCHHLSPYKKHFFLFSNTDNLLVKGPVAVLTANRVWGVLRGEFYAVSLLFSSEEIVSVATLGNQAY